MNHSKKKKNLGSAISRVPLILLLPLTPVFSFNGGLWSSLAVMTHASVVPYWVGYVSMYLYLYIPSELLASWSNSQVIE